MINIKSNGQGFVSSATLECIGAMLAHHRASTPVTPAMPPVKVKGAEPPFEETLIQYWLASRHRKTVAKLRKSLFA